MGLRHVSALGVSRQELMETLAAEKARGLLTRLGDNSGAHDADQADRIADRAVAMHADMALA